MGIELRQIAPHDPVALELAEALWDEVEARQADNGAARPTTGRNGDRGLEFVRLDTHERLREAIRLYERRGGIPADPGLRLESEVELLVPEASA